jgi:hypothetical protein
MKVAAASESLWLGEGRTKRIYTPSSLSARGGEIQGDFLCEKEILKLKLVRT